MLEQLQHARKVVRWMEVGVLASQDNARLAREALRKAQAEQPDATQHGRAADVALSAIEMGLAPKVELCREADAEISRIIDRVRETTSATLRDRYEHARG